MKDDQRVSLTKRLLREGLLRLLSKKDLGKISVTELCSESGINRATFYRHYQQPRDILTEIRRGLCLDVRALTEMADPKDGPKKWMENICRYFYEQSELVNILFKYRTDEELESLMNDLFESQLPELRANSALDELDDDSLKLGACYYAGGIYCILRLWLSQPIDKSPEEIAGLILHLLNIA